MTRRLVVVGCGGLGREVWSIARALVASGFPWEEVVGFVDDDPSPANLALVERLGAVLLGDVTTLAGLGAVDAVVGVGNATVRRSIVERLASSSVHFPALVHPDATIGADVDLQDGVVVAPGVRISTHVSLGRHVHVDQNAAVAHDVVVGDFSRISPSASLTGGVEVGAGVLVGAGATLLPGVRIGADAVVGAGAVVTVDVPPGATVKGVPAR